MTSENLTPADIAAVTGNRGADGFGYGNGFEWIVILFLFAMFGGWGGNRGGYGGGGSYGGGMDLYPWLNNSDQLNNGFQNQMLNTNVASIRDGIQGLSMQLCNSCNNMEVANLQQMFSLQSALQQCCCDNRAATADLKYTVATENCADRTQALMNTRDIIESNTRNTQAILDKLCQLELDNLKQDNANLRTQLNMANLAASQVAQTAELRQSNATQLNNLVSELRSCPIPTQPVYGSQPIFTCGGNQSGCGCGMVA